MANTYWKSMDKKAKAGKPKFNFLIVILIIIFSFGVCFGIYMVMANRDIISPPSETTAATTIPAETTTEPQTTTTAESTTPVVTETTTAAAVNPLPATLPQDMSYFDDCVFIGDSITSGFSSYGIIPEKNVYASIGMNIDKINTEVIPIMLNSDPNDSTVYSIQEMTIIEALKVSRPNKVYIMLGSNGIVWMSNDHMIAQYQTFVDSIKSELPDTDIYILSIPPVTVEREAPDNANGQILNENIDSYNSMLLKFANDNGLYFVDINTPLKGNDGKLPSDWAARDGMHFNKNTYYVVIDYILNHTAGN